MSAADKAKYEEISAFFKQTMEDRKKLWATRGKDARIEAMKKRLADPTDWRNKTGMKFMVQEMKYIGNRPFVYGFASVFALSLWVQAGFTDEDRAGSEYYQEYHMGKKPTHSH
eukprot:CAMPEP_0194043810 /NCGR_PEP_ID=MMETSP0009_2-20130614/15383_1 /TAXON_ID=210454 /ORGANISM="Grammatophora oceanica, Strain CCMP 410" /LENGTH=112 /DNA_ID=CAMNT_0038688151 /DNA_START=81 /DNA_END=419 /DNA_ORIENTATION=-